MSDEKQIIGKQQFFKTRLGVIAASVGSAVGLGNIWRFPYETGSSGGAAFLFVYILFVVAIGIPVICAEFVIGRSTRRNIAGAFRSLGARFPWNMPACTGLTAVFLIMGFYSVVAGWTLYYLYESIAGFGATADAAALHERFDDFTGSAWQSVTCTLVFLACNYLVILRGVRKGIERMANVLMPLLVVILVAFCINSLCMPGAGEGLAFLFRPDFSALTGSDILSAMGQAFFSLSVGMGTLATYAAYFSDRTPLARVASVTALSDTLVAVLAGVIIFPAVFSFGMEPVAGPRLVFEVLPSIFTHLPLGQVWAVLFFVLLFLASLTSTVSTTEVSTSYIIQEWGLSRRQAVTVNALIVTSLAVVCALSFGMLSDMRVAGLNFFDLCDFIVSDILMPLGGMFLSIFVGWRLDRRTLDAQLTPEGRPAGPRPAYIPLMVFSLKYITPVCIFLVFIFGLI